MFKRSGINSGKNARFRGRRGNAIVLVVGILALLVIIATSYVTRTHAGRVTAVSQQSASLRDDNARVIAESIADEIAGALFVRPIGPVATALVVVDSNTRRFSPRERNLAVDGLDYVPVQYGIDPTDFPTDGVLDFPWNFAQYQVVPSTNWPDFLPDGLVWPEGPGNPDPLVIDANLAGEGNQLGYPGFGDARWLADTEPVRERIGPGFDVILGNEDDDWIFTHWRHMTNLSRPGNGWRICKDISDVGNGQVYGGIVRDLNIPVEQFLTVRTDAYDAMTLLPSIVTPAELEMRWRNWFDSLAFYNNAYTEPNLIPPNFLHLRNLDGDVDPMDGLELIHEAGERPQDEFIRATARWNVGRYLADADGDGFTDSFWFLAPTMTERGIRQIAAVRIVDNGAMLNVNVGGRFVPRDEFGAAPGRTRGTTPADLALVGQLSTSATLVDWNVGFFDNRDHLNPLVDPVSLWARHLLAVGQWQYTVGPEPRSPNEFLRQDYWRRQGIWPLGADPRAVYTPFGIPDEIELRMFHGNNYPWIFSRLEGTTEISSHEPMSTLGPLRGSTGERESSEYLDQLVNQDLVFDPRRKLTTYNGARNDLMPPWLWRTRLVWDWDVDGIPDRAQYQAEMRKFDLRQPYFEAAPPTYPFILDVDGDGEEEPAGAAVLRDDPTDDDFNFDGFVTPADYVARGRDFLDRALIIRDPRLNVLTGEPSGEPLESYFGSDLADLKRAERMAAAMAANIGSYRDSDQASTLADAVPLRYYAEGDTNPGMVTDRAVRYLGMEAQPFLVEAVIAHVHKSRAPSNTHPNIQPPLQVVCYDGPTDLLQRTLVVVQIANPFDKPIDLEGFSITVFGRELALTDMLDSNRARTYVSMFEDAGAFPVIVVDEWKEVLNLDEIGAGSLSIGFDRDEDLVNVTGISWAEDRAHYDNSTDRGIELRRLDPAINGGFSGGVVVDRIDIRGVNDGPDDDTSVPPTDCDYRRFGRVVQGFSAADLDCTDEPLADELWLDVIIVPTTRWVQWSRVSRPWVLTPDSVGEETRDDLTNPRYVFSRAFVDAKSSTGAIFNDARDLYNSGNINDGSLKLAHFASRDKQLCAGSFGPDIINTELEFPLQMLQKDADFEQVGELLNVWLFGHQLELINGTWETTSTFSEWMWEAIFDDLPNSSRYSTDEQKRGVNRLRVQPLVNNSLDTSAIVGIASLDPLDFRHAIPALPAGARVLDAFVCDGYGVEWPPLLNPDLNGDGIDGDQADAELRRLKNANGFSGRMTPGLININTATPEVMRSLPHMARLVGIGPTGASGEQGYPLPPPRVRVAEAAVGYRDRSGPPGAAALLKYVPDYRSRENLAAGLRVDRGFASIGETLLLTEETTAGVTDPKSWRIDFAAEDLPTTPGRSTRISTDVVDVPPDPAGSDPPTFDEVASDVEEANLLFAGMSNLITTRSDVFTVYFKIRSFKQNPVNGVWDATDPEYIVDDSRYVMLVDRSEVNVPSDKPKIVYLEKLPK